ncbi:uncharacterized protein A1O5_08141 [Cladophialophora psammophila CBS 110553]|uniref:Heterokaryon incompatibility domain-containing protein n=1 Tax=Cladophialophora psammophila CBS 110553 TaxID=1182543 RepID=W9XD71_9EURO|nr:uncharacterized protein A1O5_08141 [Cladophialophora psammophila CBS 110553]EXJ68349.1 hypothetical protein A1O5_08141 [Cladophialophora psammophila CBS 110553]
MISQFCPTFFGPPDLNPRYDGDGYWIEWDNSVDRIVLASGMNHYFLEYDCETGLRTSGRTPALSAIPSTESLSIIRSWLDKCLNEHQGCGENSVGDPPTRLVDVGPHDGSQEPRIVCGEQCREQRSRYFALSYCWGSTTKESPWTLSTGNIDSFKAGIHLARLPRSFQDVIQLTRGLNERYIWIDCLCILQDSPDDWEKEASSMADIYANALCTIISPSPDPSKPLFAERDMSLVSPAVLNLSTEDRSRTAAVRFHPVLPNWTAGTNAMEGEESLQKSQPTRRRGWCMQEYELSRRALVLTTHQSGWICKQMQCSEEEFSTMSRPLSDSTVHNDGVLLRPNKRLAWWPLHYHGPPEQSACETVALNRKVVEQPPGLYHHMWEKLVEEFTSREITVPTDRLPAISGLAARRQRETGDQYLAGLWKNNLAYPTHQHGHGPRSTLLYGFRRGRSIGAPLRPLCHHQLKETRP